jgi:diaminohydroxyphosphoribosylaminopyrimidine deaminase/5-amino-6-(5-phosphoribosylamino)uracil reductase
VVAIERAGAKAAGATAYVTLEPCNHQGRTPPCVELIKKNKIKRVVAAMLDPNPEAAHGGAKLAAAGIAFEHGLMEAEAKELNFGFVSRMTRGRPWVRMKIAATLDGRTALANGKSQWITGPEARKDGHRWRARACAILTGHGTVRDDDPQLNVRGVDTPRQPLKIVVDSRFETPLSARVLKDGRTLVAGAVNETKRIAALKAAGADTVIIPNDRGKVELIKLMDELGRRELNELHVEGGHKLNGSLLQAGVVDELLVYLAPSVIGDSGRGMFDMPEVGTERDQPGKKHAAKDRFGRAQPQPLPEVHASQRRHYGQQRTARERQFQHPAAREARAERERRHQWGKRQCLDEFLLVQP